jgi:hypothetical protein
MGYLNRFITRVALLDISEDADTSLVVDILGFEVLGIITPDALDGSSNNVTPQIDPGNGTFYTPLTNAGAAITWWENVAVDQWLQAPQSISPLVGARLRLEFSETEDADRKFLVVLKALPESSD